MNRNQKIALGCGGAGCLGLIVVVIVGCLMYFLVYRTPARRSYNYNFNYNASTNRNSNSNNSDFSTNTNANTNDNTNDDNDNSANSNSSSSSPSSVSSMSDDDKHKLYQAASMTGEGEVVRRVSVKLGLINEDFTPTGEKYETFVAEHVSWVMRNTDFIRSINTPAKARAYVNEHFPE